MLWRRLPRAAAGEAGTGKVKLLPHPACSLSELVSLGLARCREKRVPPCKKAAGPGRGATRGWRGSPAPRVGAAVRLLPAQGAPCSAGTSLLCLPDLAPSPVAAEGGGWSFSGERLRRSRLLWKSLVQQLVETRGNG